jgi:Tol biopolymer transport system component
MDIDEGHPNPVFESPDDIDFASFTFDGNQIVFVQLGDSGGLRRVLSSGSVYAPSIENSSGWGNVLSMECSPVDSTVAFFQEKDDEVNIYSMSFGGGEPTRLTDFTFDGNREILNNSSQSARTYYLSWFKDGSRLVFTHLACSDCDTFTTLDLFLLPATGGEPTQIPPAPDRRTRPMTPSMSPGGKKMVVEDGGLWLIELDEG